MTLAQLCAGLTDLSALGANMRVVWRAPSHEVHAGDGDLRAVHQRYQMGRFVMSSLSTSVQHMGGCFGASRCVVRHASMQACMSMMSSPIRPMLIECPPLKG
jgi:hypothetical protein